ncbi:MAG: M28 family peptidase, partial [Candidatus Hydrogenedentes bacterium]|nr:M28 family peptidase [Candidatus Hydrogenedentota bacterium]
MGNTNIETIRPATTINPMAPIPSPHPTSNVVGRFSGGRGACGGGSGGKSSDTKISLLRAGQSEDREDDCDYAHDREYEHESTGASHFLLTSNFQFPLSSAISEQFYAPVRDHTTQRRGEFAGRAAASVQSRRQHTERTIMLDRLRADVQRLAQPHGRQVGTPGHSGARAYIVERVRGLGLEPYAQGRFEFPYAAGEIKLTNVLARLPGARRSLPPVLVAAHYDTCGTIPGADDNASAIAIALAMAAPLRERGLHRDIVFAFFDAEEPPHFLEPSMGSIHYYEHQRDEPIHCAVVLDLLGHGVPVPDHEDLLFVLGMESDKDLAGVIERTPL